MTCLVVNFIGRRRWSIRVGREAGARRADSGASDSLMGNRCVCVCLVNTPESWLVGNSWLARDGNNR